MKNLKINNKAYQILFVAKREVEIKLGGPITYNDFIEQLIETHKRYVNKGTEKNGQSKKVE